MMSIEETIAVTVREEMAKAWDTFRAIIREELRGGATLFQPFYTQREFYELVKRRETRTGTLASWRKRPDVPPADDYRGRTPLYKRETVESYLYRGVKEPVA